MWYLNPKNIVLMALGILLVAVSIAGGIQYVRVLQAAKTITELSANVESLKKDKIDLQAQVNDYKANIAAAKKAQARQQAIGDSTATQWAKLQDFKTDVIMEASDEKILSDYTYYFNSHGLRRTQARSDSKAGKKVLSSPGPTGADRSHRWTVKQLAANYLQLIDYILKYEETEKCYGQN